MCTNRVRNYTRGNSILDQIWISEELEDTYPLDVEVGPPLSTSDHGTVFLKSSLAVKQNAVIRTVYDCRRSNVIQFLKRLSSASFMKVYDAINIDEKCQAFNEVFYDALSIISRREVFMTRHDKAWITPFLKLLIEDKWMAYREGNWTKYNHLKEKVRSEVLKAKKNWSEK